MDPFSMTVGVISLLDISVRLTKHVNRFWSDVAEVDHELRELVRSLLAVQNAVNSFKQVRRQLGRSPENQPSLVRIAPKLDPIEQLWQNAEVMQNECRDELVKMGTILVYIQAGRKPKIQTKDPSKQTDLSKLELGYSKFRKQLRKQSKESEYDSLRRNLDQFLQTFQTLLHMIQLSYDIKSQSASDQMSNDIRALRAQIESLRPQMEFSKALRDAVEIAKTTMHLACTNKHFDIPQIVSSNFIGREAELEELKDAFFPSSDDHDNKVQKRFVISGLGGSGKTQWCCKFAQDYRKHFWGVFWVSASSTIKAKQSFSTLAKRYGAREWNQAAAIDWLSNLEVPWLLIIDDAAADDKTFHLESLFPKGERGCILITTRDESHRMHGTVGSRFYLFTVLDNEPATRLLLTTAEHPKPWDSATQESANEITNHLGRLPLALVYAGRAILQGLCTMKDYVIYHKTIWDRIDQAQADTDTQLDQEYMNVYSGFEIVYLALKEREDRTAMDALELLNMFAFLSNGGIREDILQAAAQNPAKEGEPEAEEQAKVCKTWSESFKDWIVQKVQLLLYPGAPLLPQALIHCGSKPFDIVRLRRALRELHKRALIIRNNTGEVYSMHPIIHTWVRERPEMVLRAGNNVSQREIATEEIREMRRAHPEMRIGRQALWCKAAATVLANAILLQPLGDESSDEDLRRDLLPHVEFVRERQKEIDQQIRRNQKRKWLPSPQPVKTPRDVLSLAKYSRVYSECGRWPEAEALLHEVRDFVISKRGPAHPIAVRVQLGIAGTYWGQGKASDAAKLLEGALSVCLDAYGRDGQLTLKVTDLLGESLWQQGHIIRAGELHERAIEGMTRILPNGAHHEDTLRAIDHLGRIRFRFEKFDDARKLHSKAWERMKRNEHLGPTHHDTLTAQDNLAICYLMIGGPPNLDEAYKLMADVVEKRKAKLGKEHPWTLFSILNFARVKYAQASYDEAEADIRGGLEVATRNLGETHLGTLWGQSRLGQLLLCQERLVQAEQVLDDAIDNYLQMPNARGGAHPDRLCAMFYLVHCYRLQGRFDEAIDLCQEIITKFETINGRQHPLMAELERTREALRDPEDRAVSLGNGWMVR